ncbi:MAG: PQQ-binding-like beta-propeller repeat protein [Polyangiaceae bacterium]|nr:PQQ-binding-like beta-propeller repeat protein [Polyangiaceae bacterium]
MRRAVFLVSLAILGCGPAPAPRSAPPPEPPPPTPTPQVIATGEPNTVEVPPAVAEEEDPGTVAAVEVTQNTGWLTFHGDNTRTGTVSAPAITNPRIAWSAEVGIQGYLNGPVAIGGQLVIVPSSGKAHNQPDPKDGVVALDQKTGKRLWFTHFDQDANGVAVTQSRVFATSDDGNTYALDLRTGKVVWKQAGKGKVYSYPLLVGDSVIVGDAGGYLYALAQADGKERWKTQLTGAIRGGASADERFIYAASQGGEVVALTHDGKEAWRQTVMRPPWGGKGRPLPTEIYAPPIVAQDLLILPFSRDTYYKDVPGFVALAKKNGRERWRAKGPGDWGNVRTTPALVAGMLVYAEPYSGDIVGITVSTGRMVYRHTVGPCYFPQWSSPAAAGDVVYVPRFGGSVYAVRAASGKKLWDLYLGDKKSAGRAQRAAGSGCEWDVPSGFPLYSPAAVAEDGTLFVGSGEGWLYAIRGS